MTILLVNDDGYRARGIRVLEEALRAAGHEVWVCAPSGERSASSHSMSLHDDVRITRFAENHYYCTGRPADCVLYSLRGKLFSRMPDLVVSGINHGYNLSTDILYSGTVGAASEAAMMHIPAIALSCQHDGERNFPFSFAASFLLSHLSRFLPLCSDDSIVNINVPPHPNGSWRAGTMSHLEYNDTVVKSEKGNEQVYDHTEVSFGTSILLSLGGESGAVQIQEDERTDFMCVREGRIAVSVLSVLPPIDSRRQKLLEAMADG